MSKELSYLEAIREALLEEMRRDPKVFVLGEDVGAYGGAFGVTQGLYDEFGEMRVIDTPISESAIVGVGIGAAIRDDTPVIYFEHKYLYRRAKGPVPEGDEIVPIGVAATRREGNDATLLTYGAMVAPSLEAADRLSKEGVEVDVIDLRTLLPYDKAAIFASLEKTNRVLVVHEDVKTLGIGSEISAVIMEERFDTLDAPVMRVTYPDTHPPFSHVLEGANLPNADKITGALRRLAAY